MGAIPWRDDYRVKRVLALDKEAAAAQCRRGSKGPDRMIDAAAVPNKQRILIVEDEPFIALTLEDMLAELGFAIVGSVADVSTALDLIGREQIDAALLDVSLGSQRIDAVADRLAEQACPFVFTTGYGRAGVPAAYADRAVLQKPFGMDDLALILRTELRIAGG
jgi:CheY-like chemotaxis protein